ncbi:helix-turn-helix transcriptional regulator [Streptomyces sp. NPDC046853]|uniref:helix-turn-helix transcriptional regulator n=1 Tax=Streptomyces sp. NPDC046853 TaxID=3154920 RepID=UPI0033E513C5
MPVQDWSHIGLVIRQHRRREGMSQADLAAAAGVSQRTIGNYERGRIPDSAPVIPDGYYNVASTLQWTNASVEKVLAGGHPEMLRQGIDEEGVEKLIAPALSLADAARDMGAPAELVDRYRTVAVSLIGWMAHHGSPQQREQFDLAASRPHALGEGVPPDDRERIMRALEDDK